MEQVSQVINKSDILIKAIAQEISSDERSIEKDIKIFELKRSLLKHLIREVSL